MAIYDFATITAQQALSIQAADLLRFKDGPARDVSVIYHASNDSTPPTGLTVTFAGHTVEFGAALIDLSLHQHLEFADSSVLLIGGPSPDRLSAGPEDDGVFGGPGDDVLSGGFGDDAIQGNQGNDLIFGGEGTDLLYGGQGNDRLTMDLNRGADEGDFAQGNKGDDTIIAHGTGGDTLLGGQGDDSINGVAGADFLNGNLGDDVIVGHGGAHLFGEDGADTLSAGDPGTTLSGGTGADQFVFSAASGLFLGLAPVLASTITDWEARDRLHIEGQAVGSAPGNYVEILSMDTGDAATNLDNAYESAQFAALGRAQTIAVQVGSSVFIFADADPARGLEVGIVLVGRTLADIDVSNFI